MTKQLIKNTEMSYIEEVVLNCSDKCVNFYEFEFFFVKSRIFMNVKHRSHKLSIGAQEVNTCIYKYS